MHGPPFEGVQSRRSEQIKRFGLLNSGAVGRTISTAIDFLDGDFGRETVGMG